MPFSKINETFTPEQIEAIKGAIQTIEDNMPAKFNLTKDERRELANISDERYPYVKRAIENHAPNFPNLVPTIVGTLEEGSNDLTFFEQSGEIKNILDSLREIIVDTQQVAGSEAWTWFREFYNNAQRAAANQVPGADAVVDDLSGAFEGQGNPGTPPGDGTPPADGSGESEQPEEPQG